MKKKEPKIIADHEFFKGRKKYASNVEGAYYSSRLAIAEYLEKEKRQSGAIVFREIGEKYDITLGVWQIRENVRNALKKKPIEFSELKLALNFIEKKLKIPLKYWRKESKLLDFIQKQKKLKEFL